MTPASLSLPQDGSPPPAAAPGAPAVGALHRFAGGTQELVYTNLPGYPESLVPGLAGAAFKPGTANTNIDRVFGSPNGNWILSAFADLGTTEDEVLIVNGALVQQEGRPGPWTGGLENCGTIDTRCDVNDAGDFVFATNTDGPTTSDDYIVGFVGGVWVTAARESDPVVTLPGNTYDDSLDSPLVLADGRVGFRADGIDGLVTTAEDQLLVLGSTLLMQQGVTIPSGQAGGATEFMEIFDTEDFWASADGQHWLVQGDLTGLTATDDVVIVDGAVVLQEGVIIPGSGFVDPIDNIGIVAVHMDHGGNWFARGNNDVTEDDWVVRNGLVVATVGAPILTGSTELWDDAPYADCYFLSVGNQAGDYIIGGLSNSVDQARNAVLVMNGATEVCREGDPIDLDGNGLFDDDAFINTFGNEDAYLSDARELYMVVTARNSQSTVLGQGFLKLTLDGFGTAYCAPAVANSTGASAVISADGSEVAADNDVTLSATSLPLNSFGFFLTSRTQGLVSGPGGSQGDLCLGGAIGRYVGAGQIKNSGAAGAFSLVLDLTLTPTPNGLVAVAAGETWNFQAWYRDAINGVATSNFTGGLSVDFQ